MAQLAIKGHATRGKEVIEILEMLGGKNSFYYDGTYKDLIYIIGSELELDVLNIYCPGVKDRYIIFTLEEFLEKFPYKVGDTVLYEHDDKIFFIRKMFWENDKILYELSDEVYSDGCSMPDTLIFDVDVVKLQPYKVATMEEKNNNWAKWDLPDGYEFQDEEGNVIKTVVIKLVKKQSQYPKTYEECCKVLDIQSDWHLTFELNNPASCDLYVNKELEYVCNLEAFRKLLICRDAYWKIAGEQMGLGKPWEPDYTDDNVKYIIGVHRNHLDFNSTIERNYILIFPTAEMRDVFYENFKELIESCKELL